jgi:KDO2-lipid IV(A) lauroyltransferase
MLDWIAYWLVRASGALLCRLPPEAAVWLGERLGSLAYWLQPSRTRVGVLNARAAFDGRLDPFAARRLIRASYRQLGAGVLELLRLPVIDAAYVERRVTVQGMSHLQRAVASGAPVILLTAHFGNWELASIVGALKGYPLVALARAQTKFPRLYRLLMSYRESKGCTIVHKGHSLKRLLGALRGGRVIGIVGDQASRQGGWAAFFGRPALFATGPFELAHTRRAALLPVFSHRLPGARHHIVIEPSIAAPAGQPRAAAVRQGLEAFVAALTRHVTQDPAQWLWMHKRWKHTPARRVLVLSDGKPGHVMQSLAVVDALRVARPEVTHDVVEVRFRHPLARAAAVAWSWAVPTSWGAARILRWTLAPASAQALLTRYADLIVSCGASVAPVNLLWAGENRAKAIVVMNPAPLPLSRFSLVVAPRHDALAEHPNVVPILGALSRPPAADAAAARRRLAAHPRFRGEGPSPVVTVLIGGDTPDYALTPAFAEALLRQVLAACETAGGSCLVTTSRRTVPAVDRHLADAFTEHPRCRLLLLASRDALDGTMEGLLAGADAVVVTGESISMVSEACASGRPVVVVEPPRAPGRGGGVTKHQRFLRAAAEDGAVDLRPVDALALALARHLARPEAPKPLDSLAAVREAVAPLL